MPFIGPRLANGRTRTNVKRNKVAPAVKKAIKKAIKGDKEINYVLDNTSTAVSAAGVISPITYIITPDTDGDAGNLVGRKGKHRALDMRFTCSSNTNALLVVPSYLRFILFKWKENVLPTVANVLAGATYLSPINHDSLMDKSLVILSDKLIQMDPSAIAANYTSKSSHMVHIRKALKDAAFEFDNQVTGFVSGGLWFLTLTDQATYVPSFSQELMLTYTE